MINLLSRIGTRALAIFATFGRAGIMLFRALVGKPEFRKQWPLLLKQLYNVGVQSLLIIMVSGLFIGMVLGLQGYLVLTTFSAEASLGMMVALSLLRELGPVVTALLFAGRAGSALTAEIGLMKATEQISSLEMMAVDPLRRVVAPVFGLVLLVCHCFHLFLLPSVFGVVPLLVWIGKGSMKAFSGHRCKVPLNGDLI